MYLISKTGTRANSRKGMPEYRSENTNNMESPTTTYNYAAGSPHIPKMVKRRESRIRTSFFGSGQAKRESYELSSEETDGMRSPSRSMTSSSDDKENVSFLSRRKLRKSSSHASLSSVAYAYEYRQEKVGGRKGFADLLRGGGGSKTPPTRQPTGQRNLISKPFDFYHITHGNSQQFSRMQQSDDSSLVRDWHNVVRDSAVPARRNTIKGDESTVVVTPSGVSIQRTASIYSRRRANSEQSISPKHSMCDLSPNSTSERYPIPPTPPPRISSKHCLRSLAENPTEEEEEEDECVFRPGRQSRLLHAVTTQGENSYGRKSPGVGKSMNRLDDGFDSSDSALAPYEFEESAVSELRSSKSTPDFLSLRHRRYLSTGRRPISQISAVSDTLNGTFVPSSPRVTSMSARRMSRRISAQMRAEGLPTDSGAFLDSWEEDIDWWYENEVDADCEFDWDRNSVHEVTYTEENIARSTHLSDSFALKNDMLKLSGGRESFILVEKRITGIFEDKLLLPPSPQVSRFPDSTIGVADGGFDAYEPENEDISFRPATTALRHRSISSAASFPELSYRDELNRVARQLDDHIAALNQEVYSLQPLTINSSHAFFMGNRARADSEATCGTLCSDTDTVTPIDTNEIITPSSSAHNSLHFTRHNDEGRTEKGLSFPAAALPGVIEFAPDGLRHIAAEEQEFLHFI